MVAAPRQVLVGAAKARRMWGTAALSSGAAAMAAFGTASFRQITFTPPELPAPRAVAITDSDA
ncbi:MAG TPA: hypothetical protein VF308_07850 [Caldimonas sp.]